MDAILDTEMEQIITQLPISDELKLALVKGEGELANYLEVVSGFEKGVWDPDPGLKALGDSMNLTIEKYTEAIGWADSLTSLL